MVQDYLTFGTNESARLGLGSGDAESYYAIAEDARPRAGERDLGTRKLYGLQYLRALAAVSIIVYHAADRANVTIFVLESAVDLFFILSGFLMVAITSPDTSAGPFMTDRIKRIVPVYWIVTSLMLIAYFLGIFRNLEVEFWHVVCSYLFIPSYSPSTGEIFPLLVPGWTLNFEMLFYSMFALLIALRTRRLQMPILSAIFIGLVLYGLVFRPQDAVGKSFTDPLILNFLLGAWLGVWWKHMPMGSVRFGWTLTAAALITLALIGIFHQSTSYRLIFFGLPIVALLAGVLGIEQRPGGIPSIPLPRLLGDASYSIYLWHTLIISLVARVSEMLRIPPLAMVIVAVIASVIGGLIGYSLIEAPILKAMKRLNARRAMPASVSA